MITNIFLPEKIGGNYLFTKRVVGLDLQTHTATATKVVLKGTKQTIQAVTTKQLNRAEGADALEGAGNGNGPAQRVAKLLLEMGSYDAVHVNVSSAHAVLRTVRVPFVTREKIAKIIPFEVEPLLPFALQDAMIDFIITQVTPEPEQGAQVLVAAVPKKYIVQELETLAQLGLDPDALILDAFALYGLYTAVPAYAAVTEPVGLLRLNLETTQLLYIENGELIGLRTLSFGVSSAAKQIAQAIGRSSARVMEDLERFGFTKTDDPSFVQAARVAFDQFWQKIQLTLNSFTASSSSEQGLNRILVLGTGVHIPDIDALIAQKSGVACELFALGKIAENSSIEVNKSVSLHPTEALSVALALPTDPIEQFNLRSGEFKKEKNQLFLAQFFTLTTLVLLLFGGIIGYSFVQQRRLSLEITNSEQETIAALGERFASVDAALKAEEEVDLDEATRLSEEELKKEEAKWFAFSNMARASILQYLLELTSRIDKPGLGFVPEMITIGEGAISLKARVNDYESLKKLEHALEQSKLFKRIEKQNDPKFTMKIELKPIGGRP